MVIMEIYKNLDLEDMENEIWKDVAGYEGLYEVSSYGRVKSLNYGGCKGKVRIMKQTFNNNDYLMVGLTKDKKRKKWTVHKLVAQTFIENVENKPCVDHISTVKTDNRVENLRFVTHKENNNNELTKKHNREAENNRYKGKKHTEETKEKLRAYTGKNAKNYKGFVCIFPNGNITEEMLGKELGELLGISEEMIRRVVKSNKPYKPFPKRLKHLDGIRIFYAEDYKKLVGDSNDIS